MDDPRYFDDVEATERVARTMAPRERLFFETSEVTPLQAAVLDRLREWGIRATPHASLRPGLEHLTTNPDDYVWDGMSFLARIRVGRVYVPASMLVGRGGDLSMVDDFATGQVAYWWSAIERKLREGAIQ